MADPSEDRRRSGRRRQSRSPWSTLGLTIAVLMALGGPVALALPAAHVDGSLARVAVAVGTFDTPVLRLVPTPELGNAPLVVNVTVSVAGGVGPYNLSLCFGTVDHTSPPANCGVGEASWSGASALVFSHEYFSPGNFSVTAIATDSRGAGVGSTALIVVTDRTALGANAVELTGSGPAPLQATFNESVAGGTPPITLQWTFGDGTSGSELPGVPVHHVYETPGVYVPQLVVTDGAGHRTVRTLPSITVSRATAAPSFPGSATPWLELTAAFGAAAALAAAGVRVAQRRQWRREGDELVARLQDGPNRRPPVPPSP
jgi:PKD domain-containing protein